MTLRTAGLIAGVLGVILLAVGLIAQAVKPASEATPSASMETGVVVVPPEVLALSPDAVLTVSGDGTLAAHTGRTQDVASWTLTRPSVTITGISDWDALAVKQGAGAPDPTASATPSATPSDTPTPTASPSATPSPALTSAASQDIWRDTAQQAGTYTVAAADVPVGLTLVVEGVDGASISKASLTVPRTIDDTWMSQVTWWGVGLAAVGLVALIALFVDVRPAQTKGEEWLASRSAIGSGKEGAKPGGRRARRQAGVEMPVAIIPEEPVHLAAQPVTDPVPLVPISRPTPVVPPASAFEPPVLDEPAHDARPDHGAQPDHEEDRP